MRQLPICPTKFNIDDFKNRVETKIDSMYNTPLQMKSIVAYQQSDILVQMDTFTNVWSYCNKDIVMIDFDFKLGFTIDNALQVVRDYTEYMHVNGKDYLFHNYLSDRGLHSFLVSKKLNNLDDESFKMMIDMCNDEDYIAFSRVRGFCVRIGPKPRMKADGLSIQQIIAAEFVTKPAEGKDFAIGYGTPLPYILNVLNFKIEMTNWVLKQYQTRSDELTQTRYIYENDSFDMAPSEIFVQEVRNTTIRLLDKFGILAEEAKYKLDIPPSDPEKNPYYTRFMHAKVVYAQPDLILSYDIIYGVWSLCSTDMLMVDFDVTETYDKMYFINYMRDFTNAMKSKGFYYLFWIHESTKGVHAFLVNRKVRYDSEESDRLLSSLSNDPAFANFVKMSSHCVRVGPKILLGKNGKIKAYQDIVADFVAAKCLGEICEIGYGTPLKYMTDLLSLQGDCITFITDLYKRNFQQMTGIRPVTMLNREFYMPTDEMFTLVKDYFTSRLDEYKLDGRELSIGIKYQKPTKAKRYTNLLSDNLIRNCSQTTVEQVEYLRTSKVVPLIQHDCLGQTILMRGPKYPFIVGHDARTSMTHIKFYDLLMIDWDELDSDGTVGSPKTAMVELLERFLNSQGLATENEKLSTSEMCFKLYETTNGVHAYLISHRAPYYKDSSTSLLIQTCSDVFYAAFCREYGYSVRLTPKIKDKKNQLRDPAVIISEFTQKPGVVDGRTGKRVTYIGNTDNINPYLEALTDLIMRIQMYIANLGESIIQYQLNHDPTYFKGLVEFIAGQFSSSPALLNEPVSRNNAKWAKFNHTCPYISFIR